MCASHVLVLPVNVLMWHASLLFFFCYLLIFFMESHQTIKQIKHQKKTKQNGHHLRSLP